MAEKKPDESLDTLEDPATVAAPSTEPGSITAEEGSLEGGPGTDAAEAADAKVVPVKVKRPLIQTIISKLNIYLLMFILILVISGGFIFISYQRNKKAAVVVTPQTQPLTEEALADLKSSDTKVGDPKQTLAIESNAIFSGKVLIRDSLDVAGTIKVGGALNLPGITVTGTSNFDQIQANNLSVAADTNIQGQLNVKKTLTVAGGASFGGPISAPQLSIEVLQINNDLQINRHIDTGGGTPSKVDGGALGAGGTSSVSGTDTAGTITINTGSNPPVGCFITVTFTNKFNGTPHMAITPVGSDAAALNYYINRTTSNFSVCTTNAAPVGKSFSFDYVALD